LKKGRAASVLQNYFLAQSRYSEEGLMWQDPARDFIESKSDIN
jgi:hypothetical protein